MNAARRLPGDDDRVTGGGAPPVRTDTIVAVATAPGRGAVGIVRLSGPRALEIAARCVRPMPAADRSLYTCTIHTTDDPTHILDRGLVASFRAPRSYTGEDVVELQVHGGRYVPDRVAVALVGAGARPAERGEFTTRAVLNGKLDLVQAEAIGALIDARSSAEHRMALHGLSGALTREIAVLREHILATEALLAYDLDFPEEDDGPVSRDQVRAAAIRAHDTVLRMLATAPAATLGRDGALVVLAGPPNAGKSSLFNALIGEARTIVSDEPGTTRDAVEVMLDTEPWPLRLVDTAGLRDADGTAERLGIEVSERYLRHANVVVACEESPTALDAVRATVARLTQAPIVGAWTKSDLRPGDVAPSAPDTFLVSAATGDGVDALRAGILATVLAARETPDATTPAITSARQRASLELARAELEAFLAEWESGTLPVPVAGTHLRAATAALDEIIGTIGTEEVLARVFSSFCVGK
jgi:tRNA modification GTPase